MSLLLAMNLLSRQRKLIKKRARRTHRQIQPRPEMTMEELEPEYYSCPENVFFSDGMAGVKEPVHAPEREEKSNTEDDSGSDISVGSDGEEELNSDDDSYPACVDFPDGMSDGVKEPVHAPEKEEKSSTEDDSDWEVISVGSDGELYTVEMKEEWEFYKRAREKTPNSDELLEALSNEDYYQGIRVAAVEFLNKALGISNGSDRYRDFMCNEISFGCRLFDDQYEIVLGHEDVKKVIPRPEFSMGDVHAL